MLVYTRREEKGQAKRPCKQSLPRRKPGNCRTFQFMLMIQGILQNSTSDTNGSERFAAHERYGFFPSSVLVISFLMKTSGYRYEIQWTN